MWKCINCGKLISDSSNFCVNCQLQRPKYKKNYCTNPKCRYNLEELKEPTQKICDICGSLSTFGKEIEQYC